MSGREDFKGAFFQIVILLFGILFLLLCIDAIKTSHAPAPIKPPVTAVETKTPKLKKTGANKKVKTAQTRKHTKSKKKIKQILEEETAAQNSSGEEIIVFNPNTLIFHKEYCKWARKCKKCIRVKKSNAIEQGARPCKICGH